MSSQTKLSNQNIVESPAQRTDILELSALNISDDEINEMDISDTQLNENVKIKPIEDFEQFKKQFNLREILDKLIIKREFFIPSKAMDINQFYVLEKEIGEGAYGKVYLAKHKKTGIKRAIKLISRQKIKRFDRFINEIRALKTLLYEIYEDEQNVYLVQEVCTGGELFDKIVAEGHFTETKAAIVFKQILQSILYTHKNSIVHRDLKPENFLFENNSENALIKLIDFGLSTSYLESVEGEGGKSKKVLAKLKTCAGTSLYMAPEVIMKQYSYACDLWSAGVILYIMLAGYPPFYGDNDIEVFEKVINYQFDFDDEVWLDVSDDAKDLINQLLVHQSQRLDSKGALSHPWIEKYARNDKEARLSLNDNVIQRIASFSHASKIQQIALTFIAHQCESEEIVENKKIFFNIDKNNDGYITLKELKEAMKGRLTEDELQGILRAVDTDKNGAINYTEFIAATLKSDVYQDSKNIQNAFEMLDKDGNGYIEEKELAEIIGLQLGTNQEMLRRLMSEVDDNGDNKISFNEFKRMLTLLSEKQNKIKSN
eukprot:403374494